MTREEAIMVLKMVEAHGLADEAKRMAIEALKADTVSREEYYDLLRTKTSFANATIPMFKESEEAYKAWTGEEMGGDGE